MAGLGSEGAYGMGALRAAIMQKLQMQRDAQQQAFQNDLAMRGSDRADRQLEETSALRKQQQEAMEQDRLTNQARNIAADLSPNQSVSAPTVGILKRAGRGDLVKENPEAAGGQFTQGADWAPGEQPGAVFMGTAAQKDRITDNDRASRQLDDAARYRQQQDAEQRRRDDETSRHNRATEGATNQNRDLQNQLRELQIQTAQDKLNNARTDREKATQSAQSDRAAVYDVAKELMGDKSLNAAVGPFDARMPTFMSGTQDFENRMARLKNLLSLENRSKLKGQGAVSDFEGRMLERAATSLDPRVGEKAFKAELQRIMDATGVAPTQQGGPLADGGGGSKPHGGDRRLTARNPKTGETLISDDGGATWHK